MICKADQQKIKNFYKLWARHAGNYSIISCEPIVIYAEHFLDNITGFAENFRVFLKYFTDENIYLLHSRGGFAESRELVKEIKNTEITLKAEFSNVKNFHLCNTFEQVNKFEEENLESILCNHNCFIDQEKEGFRKSIAEKLKDNERS